MIMELAAISLVLSTLILSGFASQNDWQREDVSEVNYLSILQNLGRGQFHLLNSDDYATDLVSSPFHSNLYSLLQNQNLRKDPRSFDVSEKCIFHTEEVMKSLVSQEMWAVKVFDSSGKLSSGLVSGNLLWLGSYHECMEITHELKLFGKEETFHGKHCAATIANVSASAIPTSFAGMPFYVGGLKLGICLSSVCSENDTAGLLNTVISMASSDYGVTNVVCAKENPLDTSAIVVISILAAICLILTAATIYDLLVYRKIHKNILIQEGDAKANGVDDPNHARSTLRVDEFTPLLQPRPEEAQVTVKEPDGMLMEEEQSLKSKVLVGVSLYSNCLKLISTEISSGTLGCLHGIRFLSLSWVILGHTSVFGITVYKNPVIVLELMKQWSFQVVLNGTVSVDSFFLLSGALVAYHLLHILDQRGGPRHVNWVLFYFHRFWRLSAPYMLVLAVHVTLFKYWGEGPLWPQNGFDQNCRKDWWVNLLYLNNVIPNKLLCLGWSWYLACDFQFYLISPIILLLFYKKAVFGIVMTTALWLASTIYTMVIVVLNSYPPGLQGFLVDPFNTINWFTDVYVTPWCRIGPYLVGLSLGYILHQCRGKQIKIHWAAVCALWLAAALCNLTVLYGLFGEGINGYTLSVAESAIYNGLHRTGWALGLAWVIFACVHGYAGIINKILCWGPFVLLSRLTFMAYLIHPIVMYWYYFSRQSPIYLDNIESMYLFLSHLFTSYGIAFVLTLAVESPLIGLEKIVLKRY